MQWCYAEAWLSVNYVKEMAREKRAMIVMINVVVLISHSKLNFTWATPLFIVLKGNQFGDKMC